MTRESYLKEVTLGTPERGEIQLSPYNKDWPCQYEAEAEKIRRALGTRIRGLEHVGSTSVLGLMAKPILDILLLVEDSSDERAYVPFLEQAGYVLRIREQDWYEHRMLKGTESAVNLHVFSQNCPEAQRMILFRNWLRRCPEDRERYAETKKQLAQKIWKYVQDYADQKTQVVRQIMARAESAEKDWK